MERREEKQKLSTHSSAAEVLGRAGRKKGNVEVFQTSRVSTSSAWNYIKLMKELNGL